MSPAAFIETALLMGLFVAAGGGYAGLYSIGRLRGRVALVRVGFACWAVAATCALAIGLRSPLAVSWKLLIAVSALAYAVVPPMTWRYMKQLHLARSEQP